ncbi:MAG: hypothetical protein IPN85_07685 [Flavobacteriales bacterium]|nr:hypothetical protein [Flavobacteriales bacterium]
MNEELSTTGGDGVRRWLDQAEVLAETVAQLCKDLSIPELATPEVGEGAFEALRQQVLPILEDRQRQGQHALGVVLYRVDVPEAHAKRSMAAGGLPELAGQVVLRCLQKVLTRKRFAGLG